MYLADRDRPTINWLIFADSRWAGKVHVPVHLLLEQWLSETRSCCRSWSFETARILACRAVNRLSRSSRCFSEFPYTLRKLRKCVNETQPGEAGAWPGWGVVRELLKWGDYGLIRFSGQVDGTMSWRGASPQSLRTCARSEPLTLLSKSTSLR